MDIGKLNIPESPGVYLMKKNNKVIYVGKAKNLKNRVSSYFNRVHESEKTNELVKNIEDIEKDAIITRNTIPNNNKAIEVIEDKYGISFTSRINVVGNLEVIKGMVREGVGNVILPYYAVYKDIKKGDFKVIGKVDEIKDGYELIITKDKKDLSQITKFINIVKNHKIVMESTRH